MNIKAPKLPKIPKIPKIDTKKWKDISKMASSPMAFSAYAVVGVIATTVLTIVATRQQCKIESEKNPQQDILEKEPTREEVIEEVKETLKVYAPVIASAAATIFCIRKSNQKWMAYNSMINASYLAARDKMARYRAIAAPAVGAEVIQGLHAQNEATKENCEWFCIKDCPLDPADQPVYYFDRGSWTTNYKMDRRHKRTKDIYFQSTMADVMEAQYHLNRNFALRGSASLREYFAFLGILDQFPEGFGDALGWEVGIMVEDWGIEPWIDINHWTVKEPSTGETVHMISLEWEPGFTEDGSALAWGYDPDDYGGLSGLTCAMSGKSFTMSPQE